MKKPSFLLIFLLSSITALAQSVKYETFIYSSDDLTLITRSKLDFD